MIREFSEEKKEEIYGILASIDDSSCGSFLECCGRRRYEFDDWMDRLNISEYMGKMEQYHKMLIDMNASIRLQIDTVFSNVYDIDKKYGTIFKNYAEIVKRQKQRIDDMTAVLRAENDGREEKSTEDEYPYLITDKKIDQYINSQIQKELAEEKVLDSCLQAKGYTNSVEREFIIDMIREKQSEMLTSLYITGRYSSATQEEVLKQIMVYYEAHKNDKELKTAEEILRRYLTLQGLDSVKQQEIVDSIRKSEPQLLLNLYITNRYSSADTDLILQGIVDKYNQSTLYYTGKYNYPAEYIEGIIKEYETHAMVDGRFVLDNGGATIGYGHDLVEGEDFSNGLSQEEALELAIADLDMKYDDVILCMEQINNLTGKNINVSDFSENEMMFLVDFEYNRGRGLVVRSEIPENQPHTSLALLILAVSEGDDEKIKSILREEVYSQTGKYYTGLELRRMDEYEILRYNEYERDEDVERGVW